MEGIEGPFLVACIMILILLIAFAPKIIWMLIALFLGVAYLNKI